mmetsp:Transcript_33503/g.58684  ORF Transcript_33503/g.58684 Transcript_33503/m.58684 type:complete len:1193 (+) Transcript_33503:2-3580(+)
MFLDVINNVQLIPSSLISLEDCTFTGLANFVYDRPVLRVLFASVEMKKLSFKSLFSVGFGVCYYIFGSAVLVEDFTCEDCNGPLFAFGFLDTSSTKFNRAKLIKAATLVGGFLVNAGSIEMSDFEIAGVTKIPGIEGLEVSHSLFNLAEKVVFKRGRFYDFQPMQFGFAVIANCTDVTFQDLSIEGLLGERGFVIDNCRRVLIKSVTITSSSTSTLLVCFNSYDVSLEGLSVSGTFPKQLISLYSVKNFNLRSVQGDASFHARTLFQISHSQINLFDSDFSAAVADSLFTYSFMSEINAYNMKMFNFTGIVGRFIQCSLHFQGISVFGGHKSISDIELVDSSLVLDSFSFQSVEADSYFLKASNSGITWTNGIFSDLKTTEDSLFQVIEGTVHMTNCTISKLTCKFMNAYSASVSLNSTIVFEVDVSKILTFNAESMSPFYLESCDVHVSRVFASNNQSVSGGLLSAKGSKSKAIRIEDSSFNNCTAQQGGALYIAHAPLEIASSHFQNNTAQIGGCIVHLSTDEKFSFELLYNEFISSSASIGGAVYWNGLVPVNSSNTFVDNTAVYGPNLASYGIRLARLNDKLEIADVLTDTEAPGQFLTHKLLLGLFDCYGQLVKTDNSSYVYLTMSLNTKLAGSDTAIAREGIFNYTLIKVLTQPGTNASVVATHSSHTKEISGLEYSFDIRLRECVVGEITLPDQCVVCPELTYSLNPSDNECRVCPTSTICMGGSMLYLNKGYWRLNILTDDIYKCYYKSSCLGGHKSECETGYKSRLCMSCAEGWERSGRFKCTKCLSPPYQALLSVLFAIMLGSLLFLIMKVMVEGRHPLLYETFKLSFDFIQTFSILMSFKAYSVSILSHLELFFDQFTTFGISWLSSQCLFSSDFLPNPYTKAIIFSVSPVIYSVYCKLMYLVFKPFSKSAEKLGEVLVNSIIAFHFMVNPFIIKHALDLVVCQSMEQGSEWLIADMSIRCWSDQHTKFVNFLAIPSLVVWGLLVPTVLFFILLRCHLVQSEVKHLKYFKSCLYGLKAQIFWWEIVAYFRKALLITASSMMIQYNKQSQLLTGLFVLLIGLSMHYVFSPYFRNSMNYFEYCYLSVATVFLILSISLEDKPSDNSPTSSMYVTFIFLVGLATLMLIFAYFLYAISPALRRRLTSLLTVQLPESVISTKFIDRTPPPSPCGGTQDLEITDMDT